MSNPSQAYVTRLSQTRTHHTRDRFRHAALTALFLRFKLTGALGPLLSKNRIQFLYLHYIFEDEETPFLKLIETLSQQHRFISYSEAVERTLKGDIDQPSICFSFDDGVKNCLQAAEILDRFGIRACFFLNPSIVGATDYPQIKAFCRQRLYMPPVEFMAWDDIESLLDRGHEIGSHTVNHLDLGRASDQQAKDEIYESHRLLTQRFGQVKHFSWPYGKFANLSPIAARAVFDAGYRSCASAQRGCHTAGVGSDLRKLAIRRDQVIAGWPLHHVLYFLAQNSRAASPGTNDWPHGWQAVISQGSP